MDWERRPWLILLGEFNMRSFFPIVLTTMTLQDNLLVEYSGAARSSMDIFKNM